VKTHQKTPSNDLITLPICTIKLSDNLYIDFLGFREQTCPQNFLLKPKELKDILGILIY
jgi:hypothetical protein